MAKVEIIQQTRRCPQCRKTTLNFNVDTNTIECSSCGYRAALTVG